jgi:hypothetical protein
MPPRRARNTASSMCRPCGERAAPVPCSVIQAMRHRRTQRAPRVRCTGRRCAARCARTEHRRTPRGGEALEAGPPAARGDLSDAGAVAAGPPLRPYGAKATGHVGRHALPVRGRIGRSKRLHEARPCRQPGQGRVLQARPVGVAPRVGPVRCTSRDRLAPARTPDLGKGPWCRSARVGSGIDTYHLGVNACRMPFTSAHSKCGVFLFVVFLMRLPLVMRRHACH